MRAQQASTRNSNSKDKPTAQGREACVTRSECECEGDKRVTNTNKDLYLYSPENSQRGVINLFPFGDYT